LADAQAVAAAIETASLSEIASATYALQQTMSDLVLTAATQLAPLVDLSELRNQADYTAESWAPFALALADAQAVAASNTTDQPTIDAARNNLQACLDALVGATIEQLQGLISSATAYSRASYTIASWVPFTAALAEAQAVASDSEATSGAIAGAFTQLLGAINGLIPTSPYYAITAPTGARVQITNQINNYNIVQIAPLVEPTDNGDGTSTWSFPAASGNSYRVSMAGSTTKAGYLSMNGGGLLVVTLQGDPFDTYTTPIAAANGIAARIHQDDHNLLLNVPYTHQLQMQVGQTERITGFRIWQIINSDTENKMIEPDFHFTTLQGAEVVDIAPYDDYHTSWVNLTAVTEGVAVIEVTYEAIEITGTAYNPANQRYGAVIPERKAIIVVTVGDDQNTDYGLTVLRPFDESYSNWDSEADTWYMLSDSQEIRVQATDMADGCKVEEACISVWNPDVSDCYQSVEDDIATIYPGNNIVCVTVGTQDYYQVIRGMQSSVSASLAGGDINHEALKAGDQVTLYYTGLAYPVPKMSGIYNPVNYTNYDPFYSKTVTINEDMVDQGCIPASALASGGFGSIFGAHRTISNEGVGMNGNAGMNSGSYSIVPAVPLNYWLVGEPVVYNCLNVETGVRYIDLAGALSDVENGQTIRLLADINSSSAINYAEKTVTFDVNGFVLNVGGGIYISSGGELILVDSSESQTGQLNAVDNGSFAVYASTYSKVTVTNVSGNFGVFVEYGSDVCVLGDINVVQIAVDIAYNSYCSVEGTISVDSWAYVIVNGIHRSKSVGIVSVSKPGYYEYGDINNTIWVKDHSGALLVAVAKTVKITQIGEIGAGLQESDYTPESWAAFIDAIDTAFTQVNAAISVAEVELVALPDCNLLVPRSVQFTLYFDVTPATATVTVTDVSVIVPANLDGSYLLVGGLSYSYTVSSEGFVTYQGTVIATFDGQVVTVSLKSPIDALQAAIAEAQSLTASEYTDDSWANLVQALIAAQAVADDSEASQTAIISATQTLLAAINALVIIDNSVTITVMAVDYVGSRFVLLPTEIRIEPGLALAYGYQNAPLGTLVGGNEHGIPADGVSALDALMATHEFLYGTGFDTGTYLSGSSSFLTQMFGLGTGSYSFSINSLVPMGDMSDGYAINEYAVKDGDWLTFIKLNDSFDDWASYFTMDGTEPVYCLSTQAGKPLALTLVGYDPMDLLMGTPGSPSPTVVLSVIEGAHIQLIDPVSGELTDFGFTTDANGHATITFNQAGTYYLSAIGQADSWMGGIATTGLPYCMVFVGPADPVCQIVETGVSYQHLSTALAALQSGQTIKLLDDIDYHSGLLLDGISVTFDTNGHVLNFINDTQTGTNYGDALEICNGGELKMVDSSDGPAGELNFFSYGSGTAGIYAYNGATATVTNIYSEDCGIYGEMCEITVEGAITVTPGAAYMILAFWNNFGPDDYQATSSKPGYRMYTAWMFETVWVKEPGSSLDLGLAKQAKAALIKAVLDGLVETDYTLASWAALGSAIAAALADVEAATSLAEVEAVEVPDASGILVLRPAFGAPGSGDLNGDGIVDMSEALQIAQAVVGGGLLLSDGQFDAVDMDGDGLLTMADVVLIMRRAAGL
jgi:hypothetical protein